MSKIYSIGDEKLFAVNNATFSINEGEFVAITGKSGSGKSTLMNILGCLDRQTEGEYILNNQDVSTLSSRELARIRNREIGFIFQGFYLLNSLDALHNVMLPLKYSHTPRKEREKLATQALISVGLGDRLLHYPSELSGGQQQRVAIARAIVTSPSIILADEPTGNLDSQSTQQVNNILESLWKKGKTIIMITHENVLPSFIQKNIIISDGKVGELNSMTSGEPPQAYST